MLKTISVIFGFLIAIFLIAWVSLFNGIEINNINYKNINIDKLYLKYDKSLILSTPNLIIYNKDKTNYKELQADIQIDNIFDLYSIRIKKLLLKEPYIQIKGQIYLNFDPTLLDFSKRVDLNIHQFDLIFDKNLQNIKAKECKLSLYDDTLHFEFTEPKYVDFDLDDSKVVISNLSTDPTLYLGLYSKDKLKPELLKLLTYYDVSLPIEQISGKQNNIYTKIVIPFLKNKVEVSSKVDIKNALLKVYDKEVYVEELNVTLSNNKLLGQGIFKTNDQNSSKLNYNISASQFIDFEKEYSKGKYHIQDLNYKKINIKDTHGYFDIDFKKEFNADIFTDRNSNLYVYKNKIDISNFHTNYKNNSFYTTLDALIYDHNLSIHIDDTYQINQNTTKGKITFDKYKGENFYLKSDTLTYENLFDFNNSKITGIFDVETKINDDIYFDLDNVAYTLDYKNDLKIDLTSEKSTASIYNDEIIFKKLKLNYLKDNLYSSFYMTQKDKKYKGFANIETSIVDKRTYGDLVLNYKWGDILNLVNKKFTFDMQYQDQLKVTVPQLDSIYKDKQISVQNITKAVNYLKPKGIKTKGKGSITIDIKDENTTKIAAEDFSLYLSSNIFDKKNNKEDSIQKHSYDAVLKNGLLKYDDFTFYYDELTLKSQENNMQIKINKGYNNIIYNQTNKDTKISSKYINSDYMNKLLGKNWFKDGYITLNINKQNDLSKGIIRFNEVDVKNLTSLNNIMILINSTPALINPLLALPNLYRLGQSGFDTTKYRIEDGYVNFTYNDKTKYLNMYDINTKSKLIDFSGSVVMDIKNNKTNGKIDISFMKDYASVIRKLPIIRNIFLGKSGKIYTTVTLKGSLDNPKIEMNSISNIKESLNK
ncbi:MAG: AsmA-like C-terminal domain-containing protein [Campylobacterota bacterium]|nr:AsmA-like C-terminal domain-containing protein [Campylobacterota bacterium]